MNPFPNTLQRTDRPNVHNDSEWHPNGSHANNGKSGSNYKNQFPTVSGVHNQAKAVQVVALLQSSHAEVQCYWTILAGNILKML